MFESLLIANRGEIACRITGTARALGMRVIAVYSEADAAALHVERADEAVCIGPAPARESYLRVDAILDAARRTRAAAIHPGYGFLSENAELAEACQAAGVAFVGPSPAALRAMGSKIEAKQIVGAAGVPVVPGHHDSQDDAELADAAVRIGFPVLIKASAGGGGRGMRVVEKVEDLPDALAGARREAKAAFGDDRVLLERYLAKPRHIEVQVLADAHGRTLHLFERDCSLQRRHQKILEEAPAPALSAATAAAMAEAAVEAARAIDYVGAGTVEFIASGDEFYFMEMNTRLQVEHPVTELVTGLDLVEWQLRVAAGEALRFEQREVTTRGHSVEARICAESPAKGYLPSTGLLRRFRVPGSRAGAVDAAGLRLDTGVREGDEVSMHYDPLLAKLIVHGDDREQALARLHEALGQCEIVGVDTNVAMLRAAVAHPDLLREPVDTRFAERERKALVGDVPAARRRALALIALGWVRRREAPGSPSGREAGLAVLELREKKKRIALSLEQRGPGLCVDVDGHRFELDGELDAEDWLVGQIDGGAFRVRHLDYGDEVAVVEDGAVHRFATLDPASSNSN